MSWIWLSPFSNVSVAATLSSRPADATLRGYVPTKKQILGNGCVEVSPPLMEVRSWYLRTSAVNLKGKKEKWQNIWAVLDSTATQRQVSGVFGSGYPHLRGSVIVTPDIKQMFWPQDQGPKPRFDQRQQFASSQPDSIQREMTWELPESEGKAAWSLPGGWLQYRSYTPPPPC